MSTEIEDILMNLVHERGSEKSLCPSEVARAIAGKDEKKWRLLMRPVKEKAIELANRGEIVIKRKGKVIDPSELKGIYRIALTPKP